MMLSPHAKSLMEYRLNTLEAIKRDLKMNPKTYHKKTWEANRMIEIEAELRRRKEAIR